MSLGAAAMSMAGSNPQAEKLSEEAQRAFEAKDYLKSVECYSAAAQLAPTDKVYPYAMGMAYEALGDSVAAEAMYNKSASLAPDWRAPRDALAKLKGEKPAAEVHVAAATKQALLDKYFK